MSPVEQIALTINIALRRDASTLDYYRAGSSPDAFATLPKEWTADQIRSFQDYFDALMSGNLARRRQTKFMPADFKLIEARQPPLKDQYDEWLARVICYAFSAPVSPLVSQVNRATSETLRQQTAQEGLVPLKAWVKNALDHVIQNCMNEPGPQVRAGRRRRDRSARTGADAQHSRERGDQDARGGAGGSRLRADGREGAGACSHRSLCVRRCATPCKRKAKRFRGLEQKENISLTAYAGRGIVIYSGRNGGGDEALPFPDLSEIPSLHARSLGVISLASSGACMSALDLFLPLAKVDVDRRLVTGVATAETPDRSGEIFDYASSKPYFEKWSAEAAAASGGKSLGAVRVMHTPIAAGKLTDIAFDDKAKRITVCAKVVDDDEWRKVQEGVYTGFSQGGRYVKRWADPDSGLTRYTAEPHEISLVDLPCVPDATFDVVKGGMIEKRAFASHAEAIDTTVDENIDNDDCAADKGELSAGEREKDTEEDVAHARRLLSDPVR